MAHRKGQRSTVIEECPVCLDEIRPPAYQCREGHLFCGTDCAIVLAESPQRARCPVCRNDLDWDPPVKCRYYDQSVENSPFQCKYRCGLSQKLTLLIKHEDKCPLRPYYCPCGQYLNKKELIKHVQDVHQEAGAGMLGAYRSVDKPALRSVVLVKGGPPAISSNISRQQFVQLLKLPAYHTWEREGEVYAINVGFHLHSVCVTVCTTSPGIVNYLVRLPSLDIPSSDSMVHYPSELFEAKAHSAYSLPEDIFTSMMCTNISLSMHATL